MTILKSRLIFFLTSSFLFQLVYCQTKPCMTYSLTSVICDMDMAEIPKNFPSGLKTLSIDNVNFHFPFLSADNFSNYRSLEQIEITKCDIREIRVDAFTNLPNLTRINLNGNLIKRIAPGTFQGLYLQQLDLGSNNGLLFSLDVFKGLSMTGGTLRLDKCFLESFDPALLKAMKGNPNELIISNNLIRTIPSTLETTFSKMKSISLEGNPLYCNCEMNWLRKMCQESPSKFLTTQWVKNNTCSLQCEKPAPLRGKYLNNLSYADLNCREPQISGVTVEFSGDSAVLLCTASGDPSPELVWFDFHGEQMPATTTATSSRSDAKVTVFGPGIYRCDARSEILGNRSVDVNVRWPMSIPMTPTPSVTPIPTERRTMSATQLSDSDLEERLLNMPLCRKQNTEEGDGRFTVLHFVLAVVCSSLLTLVLCLFACYWIYKSTYDRAKRRCESKVKESISQAKENLYCMISAEERQRLYLPDLQHSLDTCQRRDLSISLGSNADGYHEVICPPNFRLPVLPPSNNKNHHLPQDLSPYQQPFVPRTDTLHFQGVPPH